MNNMELYEALRKAPDNALRTIQAGKLKGKTDINPMWRIKALTEKFGPCGVGWNTINVKYDTIPGANGEVVVSCELGLVYRKENGEWSEPVHGVGGNMLIQTFKGTLTTNDDAYKSAYTDAISVAAKALGVAADVYWNTDTTKYTRYTQTEQQMPDAQPIQTTTESELWVAKNMYETELRGFCQRKNRSEQAATVYIESQMGKHVGDFTKEDYSHALDILHSLGNKK